VFTVGATVLPARIAMLVLPGPGRRNEILAVGGGITAAAPIVAYLAAFGPNLPWHV
jgi:hypothetical protein